MYDIAIDHAGAIGAALMTLTFAVAFVFGVRFLAARRVGCAVRITHAYGAAPAVTKLAAALMLVSGGIHLALVPGHEGITGALFVIDADGMIRWSYLTPIDVNPGAEGILAALESLEPAGGSHAA